METTLARCGLFSPPSHLSLWEEAVAGRGKKTMTKPTPAVVFSTHTSPTEREQVSYVCPPGRRFLSSHKNRGTKKKKTEKNDEEAFLFSISSLSKPLQQSRKKMMHENVCFQMESWITTEGPFLHPQHTHTHNKEESKKCTQKTWARFNRVTKLVGNSCRFFFVFFSIYHDRSILASC